MSKEALNPETKVLAATWYTPDNWYGSNDRVILLPEEGQGFSTAKEAKQYRGLLATYIKQKFGKKLKAEPTTIDKCPTYIYCGAGPSYSCTNHFITVAGLEAFKAQYENSSEYRERQQKAEYRRRTKEFRASFKHKAA
jgi:hypothetical protein